MDRLELRTKSAGKVKKLALPGFDKDLFVRGLYSSDKSKILGMLARFTKDEKGVPDNSMENLQLMGEINNFLVLKGLVDENGVRTFSDDEANAVSEELLATDLQAIADRVRELSGFDVNSGDAVKNSEPTPIVAGTSVLQ